MEEWGGLLREGWVRSSVSTFPRLKTFKPQAPAPRPLCPLLLSQDETYTCSDPSVLANRSELAILVSFSPLPTPPAFPPPLPPPTPTPTFASFLRQM
jgi:hypothetical protein